MSRKTDHIVILATSDIHGNITGYDFSGKISSSGGLARLKTYIQVLKSSEEVILIDGGDMIGGSEMLDEICPGHAGEIHPVIKAMNLVGYDAATLGNHDFDLGTDYLLKTFSHANFPILAANVRKTDGFLLTGKNYTIIERKGVRVAVVGVVTPFVKVTAKTAQGVSSLHFSPGADAVAETLSEINGQYDVLVVSAHMGGYGEYDSENGSDSAWYIADKVPDIDILHMAHTHEIDVGRRGSTVYGEVRDRANEILRFDVYLGEDGKPLHTDCRIVKLEDYEPCSEITEDSVIVRIQNETAEYFSSGMHKKDDSPVIGEAADTFQPENTDPEVPVARLRETPVTNLINRVQLEKSGADISVCSLFNPYCDIKKGPITKKQVKDIYEFENYLVTVEITGKELKNYLESNACCYETVNRENPYLRLNRNYSPFLQDYFSGVSYEIYVKNEAGNRIRNIRVHGSHVSENQRFILAVSNYRYNTTLKKNGIVSANKLWQSEMTIREMIEDYITHNSPLKPE
ncbi:MAG: 5'-nucleotidase C-terminal domain-containing protein, partial [Sphaerochaetaceae bacterium]|nr:5'-nucleotidase C-terminal domain-containing protein [Sphaerochaetaceae bacterium]